MRPLPALLLFALVLSPVLRAQSTPKIEALRLAEEARVAWVGDSITHACRWTRMVENFLLTRYPEKQLRFWNAGVSGDRAGHVLQRWGGDVAAFRPTHAFVMLGMNDGEVQDWEPRYFAIFQRDIEDLCFKLDGLDARATLLAPTPFDPIARARYRPGRAVPHYDHVLVRYGEWLRRLATKEGKGFVDTHGPLRRANLAMQYASPRASLIPDGVHPSELGSAHIALAVCRGIAGEEHARRPRAILHLRAGKEAELLQSHGAKLAKSAMEDGELIFAARTESLPWLMIDDCRELYERSEAYRRLNAFVLRIENLTPGSHWLEIQGRKALLRTSTEWAKGVDIGMLRNHPDYFLAAQIVALNAARNQRIRKEVRELWYARKVVPYYQKTDPEKAARYEKTRRELAAAYEQNLAGIDELYSRILELRKPTLVEYRLVRHN